MYIPKQLVLVVIIWVTCVTGGENYLLEEPSFAQLCSPYDSCKGRCVGDSVEEEHRNNLTIGHLNCFCDPDCVIFG